MADLSRRRAIKLLGAASASGLVWTPTQIVMAAEKARLARARLQDSGTAFQPAYFNDHEFATVRLLVDLIIPADDRSGSATDAGVPEFMDFMLTDQEGLRLWMRGGLAWLDVECQRRFDRRFLDCEEAQSAEMLDLIAWPERAPDELRHGVAFFNRFRDLTASGFWSTRMGVDDLEYLGNVFQATWSGCPEEAEIKIGVREP